MNLTEIKLAENSGKVLSLPKEVLIAKAQLYTLLWDSIVHGKGDNAIFLGAGTGEREIYYALKDEQFDFDTLPQMHCFDIASSVPQSFTEWLRDYPNLKINYNTGTDIGTVRLSEQFYGNTRVVSLHGVLDYQTPQAASHIIDQIAKVVPSNISIRLCIAQGGWFANFADANRSIVAEEEVSLDLLLSGQFKEVGQDELNRGFRQLSISNEAKIAQNLSPLYPATMVLPDILAGFFRGLGYEVLSQKYNPTGKDNDNYLMLHFQREIA